MNRFTIAAKKHIDEDISIILICSDRNNGKNPSLKKIGGEYLISGQIDIIYNKFGREVDLVIVTGYESQPLISLIDRKVRIVHNENFDHTDFSHSVYLGLINTTTQSVFIVDGKKPLTGNEFVPSLDSYVLVSDSGEVGLLLDKENVSHFSYGLPKKLGGVHYLRSDNIVRYLKHHSENLLYHEILNLMIDDGAKFKTYV